MRSTLCTSRSPRSNRIGKRPVAMLLALALLALAPGALAAPHHCHGTVEQVLKWPQQDKAFVGIQFRNSATDTERVWLLCTSNPDPSDTIQAEECGQILSLVTVAQATQSLVRVSWADTVPEDTYDNANGDGITENCDEIATWNEAVFPHLDIVVLGQ